MSGKAKEFHAGFVALAGRPNVGKSTLLNRLLGQKLAICTPRPQTTRNRILGVKNFKNAQMVLLDTPGLHRPKGRGRSRLNEFMMGETEKAIHDVDAVVAIVEAPHEGEALDALKKGRFKLEASDRYVVEEVVRTKKPAMLVVNKVDLLPDKRLLLPLLEVFVKAHAWTAVVPISAKTGDNFDRLTEEVTKLLPEGEAIYPKEMFTDRAERWLGAEFIREQVFILTKQEIPYSTAVSIDTWTERKKTGNKAADVVIEATIHIEKEAQKKIIVGQAGRMIREIGTRARQEISLLLDCPVHLKLFVRVDADWSDRPGKLKELGYA